MSTIHLHRTTTVAPEQYNTSQAEWISLIAARRRLR